MSDDSASPIDIQLVDKIAPTIAPKIEAIAAAARQADDAIARLQAQMTGLSATKVNALTAAIDKQNASYLNQEKLLNNAVAAEQKSLAATQSLEAATSKKVAADLQAETALNRAVIAENAAAKSGASRTQQLIAEAKALEIQKASQAEFNALLGVGPSAGFLAGNTASASAATFQSNFRTQAANAKYALEQEAEAAKNAKKATEELVEGHTKLGVSTLALREPFTLLREGVSGNYTRMIGSAALLAQGLGLLHLVLNPIVVATLGLAAAIGVVVVAMSRGVSEVAEYNNALRATGGYAGYTFDQINSVSKAVSGNLNISIGTSTSMFEKLAESGRVSGDELKNIGQIALKLSQMTGESADAIAGQFTHIKGNVAEFARDFNSQFHVLTAAQIDYINELERMGQKEAAEEALARQVWAGVKNAAVEQLGFIEQAIHGVKNAASELWNYLKSIGREGTPLEKVGTDLAKIAEIKAAMKGGGHTDNLGVLGDAFLGGAGLQEQLRVAEAKLHFDQLAAQANEQAAKRTAETAQHQTQATESAKFLSDNVKGFAKGWQLANDEIKTFQHNIDVLRKYDPTNPDIAKFADSSGQLKQSVIDQIRKKYDPADVAAENAATRAAEQHSNAINKINVALNDELERMNMLKPARDAQAIADKYEVDMAGKKIPMTQAEKAAVLDLAQAIIRAQEVMRQEDKVYNELRKPMEDYQNLLRAITLLEQQHTISLQEANAQRLAATIALQEATNPLAKETAQLEATNLQLTLNKDAREIETEVFNAQIAAIQAGKPVTDEQLQKLRDLFVANQNIKMVSSELDKIYSANAGAVKQLAAQVVALDYASKHDIISTEQLRLAQIKLGQEALQLKMTMGHADFSDAMLLGLSKVLDGYKGLLPTLADDFGNFFNGIADGAGRAFGAVVTGSETASEAIHQLSTSLLSDLIGALIKLGIQWVIQQTLGETLAATAATASGVQAGALAAAWEPAAMAASIATMGGADTIGLEAYITAITAGKLATSVPGFAGGGMIGGGGSGRSDSNLIRASRGEFIVNADATSKYFPLLEMMNGNMDWFHAGNAQIPQYANGGYVSGGGSVGKPNVKIYNNYGPMDIDVEYNEDHIAVICDRQIQKRVPKMLGGEIRNANSPLSKGIARHTHTRRNSGAT